MCVFSFSVEKYRAGLEDGFEVKTNKFNIAFAIPYIYNTEGKKEYIHNNDLIYLQNNTKMVISNEAIKTNRNRKT